MRLDRFALIATLVATGCQAGNISQAGDQSQVSQTDTSEAYVTPFAASVLVPTSNNDGLNVSVDGVTSPDIISTEIASTRIANINLLIADPEQQNEYWKRQMPNVKDIVAQITPPSYSQCSTVIRKVETFGTDKLIVYADSVAHCLYTNGAQDYEAGTVMFINTVGDRLAGNGQAKGIYVGSEMYGSQVDPRFLHSTSAFILNSNDALTFQGIVETNFMPFDTSGVRECYLAGFPNNNNGTHPVIDTFSLNNLTSPPGIVEGVSGAAFHGLSGGPMICRSLDGSVYVAGVDAYGDQSNSTNTGVSVYTQQDLDSANNAVNNLRYRAQQLLIGK